MFYEFDLVVPAGTTAGAPAQERAQLNKGHITAVDVMFPSGCAGLVSVVIERGESQVWPTNPDAFFKGDGVVVRWDDDYPLTDHPLELLLKGWGPNARFPHTVTVRFELVPLDEAEAARELPDLVRRMAATLLGRR